MPQICDKRIRNRETGFTLIEIIVSASLSFICILVFVQISEPIKIALQTKIDKIKQYDDLITFVHQMDSYAKNSSSISTSTAQEIIALNGEFMSENDKSKIDISISSRFDPYSPLLIFRRFFNTDDQIVTDSQNLKGKIWALCGLQKIIMSTSTLRSASNIERLFICDVPHNMVDERTYPIEMLRLKINNNSTTTNTGQVSDISFSIYPQSNIVQMNIKNQFNLQFGFISHINLIQ